MRQQVDDSTSPLASTPDQSTGFQKPIRRSSKLTFGGTMYAIVTLFLAVGAINSQNNLLFWLFGVSIATLVVSGLISGNALMQTRISALAVSDATAGDVVKLRYSITNNSRFFHSLRR